MSAPTPQRTTSLKSKILKGASKTAAIKIAGIGLAFLFLLVMARSLTSDGFGVFAAAFSTAMLLGPAASFGQQTAVLRFWPAIDETYGRDAATIILRRSLSLAFAGALAVLTVGVILSVYKLKLSAFGDNWKIWLPMTCLAASFSLSEVTLAGLRARGSVVWAFAPRDLAWRVIVMAIIGLSALPQGPEKALFITAMTLTLLVFAQLFFLIRTTPKLLRRHSSTETKSMLCTEELNTFKRSIWGFWGNTVLQQAQQQGASVIVAFTLGPAAAGAFFAASRLANLLSIIQIASNQISAPLLSRKWQSGLYQEVKEIVSIVVLLAAPVALAGTISFLIVGKWVLSLFNPEYSSAFFALIFLSIAQVISTACGPNGLLLLMSGHENKVLKLKLISTILGLTLTFFLAKYFGVTGAAVGVTIGISTQNLLGLILCKKATGIAPSLPKSNLYFLKK